MTFACNDDVATHPPVNVPVGLTLILINFLPVLIILSLSPSVPAMVAHFAGTPHASTLIPLLVTAPALVIVLLSPFAGAVIDSVGRRRPLIIATLLCAVFGMTPLFLGRLFPIFAARLVVGVCETFIIVAGNALFADYFEPDRRRRWLTVQSAITPFLAALVLIASGFFAARAWNGAFLCYAIVLPISFAVIAFCREPALARVETRHDVQQGAADFPMSSVLVVCGVSLFATIMFYVYIIQAGLAYAEIGFASPAAIGSYYALASLAMPLGALLFNATSRRMSGETNIGLCMLIMGTAMVMIGAARTPYVILAGGFLHQLSAGMLFVSMIMWMSRILPPNHRGRGFGMWSTSAAAGQFLSPLIVGATRFGLGSILSAFFALGLLTLLGAAVLFLLSRTPLPTVPS